MAYQPIENYGIIGNMRTAALVGADGSIDWLCFPHFDSPSVFGAILDDAKGGRFRITSSAAGAASKQFYWPDTNVLVTRFLTTDGVGQVTDFMPVGLREGELGYHCLVRQVHVVRGAMPFEMVCRPAFDYARAAHDVHVDATGARFRSRDLSLSLLATRAMERDGDGVTARFVLREGESAVYVLREGAESAQGLNLELEACDRLFEETVDYWHRWLGQCTYRGRWREMVNRSVLCLKLLTFEPTGAIVAAPTASLPEGIGGVRNWDYRYTWIRDAAFTLYALLRVGFTEEARQFVDWLQARCHELEPDGSLQIMYGIDGRHELREETLDHLEGYRGSRPVRIGNGAYGQLQLDIYGELLDSIYLYNKYATPISYDLWASLRRLVDWVSENWTRADEGIWEVRGGQADFVYSKLMCWVALDRGLRLADKRSFPADRARWYRERDALYEDIMTRGWNEERKAFVQSYGSRTLDAANLIMPLVFFVSPTDPRMLATLDAIRRPLDHGGLTADGLVYRYDVDATDDGLHGEEGTFNMCSFWLVEALTRAGRLRDARLVFEQMLGYASHLGLYAEQTGLRGEALGNFPQAFTHFTLISAAFNLDRALGAGG